MIHKRLQAHIIREDCLRAHTASIPARVRRAWVQLAQQETCLRATCVSDNESRQWEAVLDQALCILLGLVEQLREVGIVFLLLVALFSPCSDGLAMEDEDVEVCVEEQDRVRLDGSAVKENSFGLFLVDFVGIERRLDHDKRVAAVLVVQDMAVESRLIWRIIEDLEELRAAKMEHELWVEGEVALETEGGRIVFAVLGEARAESNEHAVNPSKDVRTVIDFALEDGDSAHENGGSLLVKALSDGWIA